MTALQAPAPDAPAEEWGALAVRIPDWRWMPGMLAADTGLRLDEMTDDWEASLPDADDSSTAGCLLALLGDERWRLHLDDVGEWSFWVNGPPETHGTGHLIHVGESLGRAAIAAAAALGRWPGGEG